MKTVLVLRVTKRKEQVVITKSINQTHFCFNKLLVLTCEHFTNAIKYL